jgi:hypothetical protein
MPRACRVVRLSADRRRHFSVVEDGYLKRSLKVFTHTTEPQRGSRIDACSFKLLKSESGQTVGIGFSN